MSITKGIVQGGNYTFSAANQTITFSSDYLGMSLSDITYITNITSGVATVIYDPFDAAKGGVLNGLTLTLAYNTTLMADTDPLQIIVGFTPSNPAPINVNLTENPQLESQTELLSSIADAMDMLGRTTDEAERIQVNVRETATKRDVQGANIFSDAPEPINFTLDRLNEQYVFDTTGYQHVSLHGVPSNVNFSVTFQGRNTDSGDWLSIPATVIAAGIPATSVTFALNSTFTNLHFWFIPCITRFVRIIVTSYTAGSIAYTAYLRQTPLPTGPFTQIPVNISSFAGSTPAPSNASTSTSAGAGASTGSVLSFGGGWAPTQNAPNASSVLSTNVPYPLGIAGREQPYIGALGGIFRYLTVDGGGRSILGGDTPDTETRTQSKRADGSISGIPPRGVGARPNNMYGSQSLLIEDISQSEGDTTPTLLQQILVELKMLNQQLNELPLTLNLGIKMQNEVSDYRTEEYNNHVNNQ